MRRVVAVLALLASSFVVTSPASAASCDGVKVVVDFTALGGGVETGCAPGDPASGLAALTEAGFPYTLVPRQSAPMVCTIKQLPNPCRKPTSVYWSYWHATPGGTWTYSNSGAGSYDPAPGTVEGWSYGTGVAPGAAP